MLLALEDSADCRELILLASMDSADCNELMALASEDSADCNELILLASEDSADCRELTEDCKPLISESCEVSVDCKLFTVDFNDATFLVKKFTCRLDPTDNAFSPFGHEPFTYVTAPSFPAHNVTPDPPGEDDPARVAWVDADANDAPSMTATPTPTAPASTSMTRRHHPPRSPISPLAPSLSSLLHPCPVITITPSEGEGALSPSSRLKVADPHPDRNAPRHRRHRRLTGSDIRPPERDARRAGRGHATRDCLTWRSPEAIDVGVSEALLAEVAEWRTSGSFTHAEGKALDFTEQFCGDSTAITDETLTSLAEDFQPGEIVELALVIGKYLSQGRFMQVLGLDDACTVPQPTH